MTDEQKNARYALAVLFGINLMNFFDRQIGRHEGGKPMPRRQVPPHMPEFFQVCARSALGGFNAERRIAALAAAVGDRGHSRQRRKLGAGDRSQRPLRDVSIARQ